MRSVLIITKMINDVNYAYESTPSFLNLNVFRKELPPTWLNALSAFGLDGFTLATLIQIIIISHTRVVVGWTQGLNRDMDILKDGNKTVTRVQALLVELVKPLPVLTLRQRVDKWITTKALKTRQYVRRLYVRGKNSDVCMVIFIFIGISLGSILLTLIMSLLIFLIQGGKLA
jgi:hypothetical protein